MNQLTYTEHGSGRVLVWLHPFPFDGSIYRAQTSIEGVRHVVVDLAGFGGSRDGAAETLDAQAHLVLALLDSLHIGAAIFAGVSMGGYIALAIARLHPERVDALILADTKETADSDEARTNRFKLIDEINVHGSAALVDAMYKKMLAPATYEGRPELAEATRNAMLATPPAGAINALRAMAARTDSTEFLKDFRKPLLVVVGEHDAITPPSDAERMVRLTSQGLLEVIDDAGHLAMLEQPHAFNDVVSEFVGSLH